jgi:hypothetical protein
MKKCIGNSDIALLTILFAKSAADAQGVENDKGRAAPIP